MDQLLAFFKTYRGSGSAGVLGKLRIWGLLLPCNFFPISVSNSPSLCRAKLGIAPTRSAALPIRHLKRILPCKRRAPERERHRSLSFFPIVCSVPQVEQPPIPLSCSAGAHALSPPAIESERRLVFFALSFFFFLSTHREPL